MLSELARIDEFLLMGGVKRDFVDRSVKHILFVAYSSGSVVTAASRIMDFIKLAGDSFVKDFSLAGASRKGESP